jgi:hypothetical protein
MDHAEMEKDPFVRIVNELRANAKTLAAAVKEAADIAKVRAGPAGDVFPDRPGEDRGEAIANLMLCYRHLEDASMRLGKAIQARDGGTSVYDKSTTVGA